MPIYEYRCSDCGFQDEFLQKLSEPPMSVCPSCGKESLKKLLSAAGFQLKGSGWYATDFKGSGSKPAAKPDTVAKTSAESGSGASEGKASEGKQSEGKPSEKAASSDKSSGEGASSTTKAPTVTASN